MSQHIYIVFLLALAIGCADPPRAANSANSGKDSSDAGTSAADGALPSTCTSELFGRPGERTGLGGETCGATCSCGESFDAQDITDNEMDGWLAWPNPTVSELTADPYAAEARSPEPGEVCGLRFDAQAYTMQTYSSSESATENGATVTHVGGCGLCSTLQDLVAYLRNPDLTEPVRRCGLDGIRDGEDANVACLEALGFSRGCAQIWYYNTLNTRNACLEPCILALNDPYHSPDGGLNDCLSCDEENSGPVFKATAGRTRRNSGLASAICRPCETVGRVFHAYPER